MMKYKIATVESRIFLPHALDRMAERSENAGAGMSALLRRYSARLRRHDPHQTPERLVRQARECLQYARTVVERVEA